MFPAALVFDFDGTLVDTETPEFESVRRVWADHGHDYPAARWQPYIGTVYSAPWVAELAEVTGRRLDERDLNRRRRRYADELHLDATLRDGVRELLDDAAEHQVPVAIASNAPGDWIDDHLARLGVRHRFEAVVSVDRVANPKPHPEPYTRACALVGAEPVACVGFEDSVAGLTSAVAAGLYTVAVAGPMSDGHDLGFAHEHRASLAGVSLAGLGAALARRAG